MPGPLDPFEVDNPPGQQPPALPAGFRFRKTPATQLNTSTGQKELDITNLPGGGVLVRYTDGDYDIIPGSELYGAGDTGGITPYQQEQLNLTRRGQNISSAGQGVTAQGQQLSAEANRASLELQKAQFEYNKAKEAKDFAAQQYWQQRQDFWQGRKDELERLNLNVGRGNTLLGLGSRPETLWRYLFGLRGEQTPEGGPEGKPLPGYTPQEIQATLAGTGAQGAFGPAAPVGAGAAGAPSAPSRMLAGAPAGGDGAYNVSPVTGQVDPGVGPYGYPTNSTGAVAAFDPRTGAPSTAAPTPVGGNALNIPGQPGATQGMQPQQAASQASALLPNLSQQVAAESNRVAPGQTPKFIGDNGVLIYDQGGLIDEPVIGKGFLSGKSYMFAANGSPEQVKPLSGGQFNPPDLQGQISRGFAGTKSPPQLEAATGGTSLIPSAQRWNNLLPTERSFYEGSLNDLWGVQAADVGELMARGRTQPFGMTPRYAR